jgi:V/A-type H+-transporting ATPase subunit D
MQINKDLQVRENALPVLQSKEAALRAEARKIRLKVKELSQNIEEKIQALAPIKRMWSEFPKFIDLKKVNFQYKKVASINVALIDNIEYDVEMFQLFAQPAWFVYGMEVIKEIFSLKIEQINTQRILDSVEYARRKTTQKVNLYEKVQIPFFEEAIRKIKRFLEDQENLSKSSQKVIKKRMEEEVTV